MLFPPTQAPDLYPHGKIGTTHPNGLISYKHNVVRPDGLSSREAASFRVKGLEEKIAVTKGKKEKKKLQVLLDEAIDVEMDLLVEEGGDDDFTGMEVGDEDGDDGLSEENDSDDVPGEDGSVASSRSKGKGKAKQTDENHNEDGEPSSFSQIPTSLLHQHLSLPTTAISIDSEPPSRFDLSKICIPFVADIDPGEMLYLPASWWHEVTSSSLDDSESNIHMAFNYWFYPPDGLKDFDEPYQDGIVWGYLRSKVKSSMETGQRPSPSKRKRDVDGNDNKVKKAKN